MAEPYAFSRQGSEALIIADADEPIQHGTEGGKKKGAYG
jgi:hypothetical protein